MNVKEYIEQHNETNYCEAIIYLNGDIEDAIPGHTYKLLSITGKSQKEISELMPNNAAPLEWLIGYTKCVAIWYSFFKYDSITEEQLNTIQELINHGILAAVFIGYYTDELSRCELLKKYYNDEISFDEVPPRVNKTIKLWRK